MRLEISAETPYSAIPESVRDAVTEVLRGWYPVGAVDWPDVWDRVDGMALDDGRVLDIVTLVGPALDGLKKHARQNR